MRGLLLSKAIRRPTRRMHQGAYYQHLVEALGMPPGPLTPALSIPDGSIAAARRLLVERGWRGTGPVVVLAAGAAYGTAKRWVPAHVATLARGLIADRGATCVLVGSAADRATMTIVHELMPANPDLIDLTGDTTLDVLGGVLTLADVCVSNDSGAMHIAAAVGTPLVALFGPTREQETAPLTRAGGRAEVLINPVWCRPCMLRECPIDHRCMTGLTPERVRRTVDALLERAR
jgi:heptosyltransferase-2